MVIEQPSDLGQIVVLNGAPRAGKSSIAVAIQESFDGVWLNLGVDAWIDPVTPKRYRPGIGLRPGEDGADPEGLIPVMYAGLYESIAAQSRLGLNVVVDVGHHVEETLVDCARRLDGLPALFVGVLCPIDVIMERRNAGQAGREGRYAVGTSEDPIPAPVQRWQDVVHVPGIYDLEVDTSVMSAEECAGAIRRRLVEGPPASAFRELAARGS
ncbi:MAG: chloramphenicol phosphotransferase [Dehalococcoidia bacterium]|jgi:chloramphenicol 3-O phosphotransferase|nr:chloramphenicol phosphotransferase [Dehalococcoidia bacterium]